MDIIDLESLQQMLGIHAPWRAVRIEFDQQNEIINVYIEERDSKKLFGFVGMQSKSYSATTRVKGCWSYLPIGRFRCVIHAEIFDSNGTEAIGEAQIDEPDFLGNPARSYSNLLLQKIALADFKGCSESSICEAYMLSSEVYRQIKTDLSGLSSDQLCRVYLPRESDAIWKEILNDQYHLRTNDLELKVLLSQLKLSTSRERVKERLQSNYIQLRHFFLEHSQDFEDEINQICGLSIEKFVPSPPVLKTPQRLILPTLQNPVWIDLLTGKLPLNSQSVPLNLLISRLRVAFLRGRDRETRVSVIEQLREYFKKNHRSLKAELVLINRSIAINENVEIRLPNPDHEVWQSILSDDTFLPSKHAAYKLLLAKLRMEIKTRRDPVVKLKAATSIRSFMQQNHDSMQTELSSVMKHLDVG